MEKLAFKVIRGKESICEEWYDRELTDLLLTRNWFLDDQSIQEVLDCADQEAWDWIYLNRKKYPTRIRQLIEPRDYFYPLHKLKLRLVEFTDKEWDKLEREEEKKHEERFEKDWIVYSKHVPDRPLEKIDSDLDDIWEKFNDAKDALTKYIDTRSKKYIAPSSRGKEVIDPQQKKLEDYIQSMENEYDKAQKLVEDTDSIYWKTKKNEYRKIWM
jgi:ribosomal protein S17E